MATGTIYLGADKASLTDLRADAQNSSGTVLETFSATFANSGTGIYQFSATLPDGTVSLRFYSLSDASINVTAYLGVSGPIVSQLQFDISVKVSGVLANADSTPTISIIRLDTSAVVVATTSSGITNPTTGQYQYLLASPMSGVTYQSTWNVVVDDDAISFQKNVTAPLASAIGQIITQQDVDDFLGDANLEILSQQDADATTVSVDNVQRAINKAEARAMAILGNGFKIPLTVNSIAIISATSSISYPLLVTACCQYAAFWLNKWRQVQSLSDQNISGAAIDRMASAWESDADDSLRMMVRYANGYGDGQAVDLDLRSDSPRAVAAGGIPAIQGYGERRAIGGYVRLGYW